MSKFAIIAIIAIIAVILVLAGLFVFSGRDMGGQFETFAACLASKNVTMYGAESCSWCQKEKAGFGSAFKLVPYVECPDEPQKCIAAGIEGTPTWIFPDGRKLVGYQGVEKLSQASGCPLTQN